MRSNKLKIIKNFLKDTRGGVTLWSLFNLILILFFAGLALDVNNAVRSRTQLQGAADAAGHAALFRQLKVNNISVATAHGISVAEANMPTTIFGETLATADVEFGNWDRSTRTFSPGAGTTAVRVTARRLNARSNSVGTFLLKLVGVTAFELNRVSVWDYEDGICPTKNTDGTPGEGFFAIGKVDMQTDNEFGEDFCIHSEDSVQVATNNKFNDGAVISMPMIDQFKMPTSGWKNNEGLVLNEGGYPLLVDFFQPGSGFDSLVNSYDLQTPYSTITVGGGQKLTQAMIDAATQGATTDRPVIRINCAGNGFDIAQNETISGVALVTDCKVKFLQGSQLQDMILVTTSTDGQSLSGPNNTIWGSPVYCSNPTGVGDVTVLTKGGIHMAADFEAYGTEIITAKDVKLAAKADGNYSINVVSGGAIDVTAKSKFGFCPADLPNSFQIPALRMVM